MEPDGWGSTSRRGLFAAAGLAAGSAFLLPGRDGARSVRLAPAIQPAGEELTIDLAVEPATLDPALVYESDGWSVVHSIYDRSCSSGRAGRWRWCWRSR